MGNCAQKTKKIDLKKYTAVAMYLSTDKWVKKNIGEYGKVILAEFEHNVNLRKAMTTAPEIDFLVKFTGVHGSCLNHRGVKNTTIENVKIRIQRTSGETDIKKFKINENHRKPLEIKVPHEVSEDACPYCQDPWASDCQIESESLDLEFFEELEREVNKQYGHGRTFNVQKQNNNGIAGKNVNKPSEANGSMHEIPSKKNPVNKPPFLSPARQLPSNVKIPSNVDLGDVQLILGGMSTISHKGKGYRTIRRDEDHWKKGRSKSKREITGKSKKPSSLTKPLFV